MKTTSFWINRKAMHLLFTLVFFSCFNPVVHAQTDEEADKTLSPYFVVLSDNPETDNLPLKSTSAEVKIAGVIADVTIRQVYVNSGKNRLEAIYTFPLSTRAAVYAMEMVIGSRVLTAKIEEKQKAREKYEEAKKEGKRTSLLEQSRPNVFTMNVANIAVNDTITVELKYTELLIPENGEYSFVYPTVVGPRYSNKPKATAAADDNFVNAPFTREGVMPFYNFGFSMAINSAVPVQDVKCETHKTVITYPALNSVHLSLDPSEINGGNRDVIVSYSLQGNKIESGVMLYEGGGENFFMLMVQPPRRVVKEDIPPREYIFIVDVSGSMRGFPLDISKKLLRNLILNLRPDDKFNVLLFSGYSATLSSESLNATQENFDKAVKFIDAKNGGGGTELLPAMRVAFALPRPDPDLSRSFVIITDGFVDIEKETFDFIRKNCGNTNFFSFGIGSSVNRYLMEGMAFMGNGKAMIITEPSKAAVQAEKFRNYINTPVLTQIKTDFGQFQAYEAEPSSVPDMLAERPIIIYGKYRGNPAGTVTVKGKVGRKPYKQSFDLSKAKPAASNEALKYLWAREKIKLLEYYASDRSSSSEKTGPAAEITQLGLKYNLMTNYTSFIAVDEEIVADKDGNLVRVKQANPLPQGVSDFAVGYDMELDGNNNMSFRFSNPTSVSEDEIEMEGDTIFESVEIQPMFPGGRDSLISFMKQNIVYPAGSKSKGIAGTVFISFTVETDGSITGIKVLKGVNEELDNEAKRVVSLMPKWIPGKQNGNIVEMQMTLPVKFSLN